MAADTLGFGGLSATLMPGYDRPRRGQNLIFTTIPGGDKTVVTDLGTVHSNYTFGAFISETTTDGALTKLAQWQALEGTSGTLTLTVNGTANTFTTCYLNQVTKTTRAGKVIGISLQFTKV